MSRFAKNIQPQKDGLEVEVKYPLIFALTKLRDLVWNQPASLDVRSSKGKRGGLIEISEKKRFTQKLSGLANIQGKSGGWVVAGVPFLEASICLTIDGSYHY